MIASAGFRYATLGDPCLWPAMVRERAVFGPGAAPDPDVGRAAVEANAPTLAANRVTPSSNGVPSGAGEDGDDELFLLGERIADLAARINSAESRMMTLIADFDRRGGWQDSFSSCAEWLAWRIGIKIGPARERVRTARALEGLPQTADALKEGRISYAKVRALTRVAKPGNEGELLEFALAGSAAKLERTVRPVEEVVPRRGADRRGSPAPQPRVLGLRGRRRDVRGEGTARAGGGGGADAGRGGGIRRAVPV